MTFEKLNQAIDDSYNESLDVQYMIRIMAAEMQMCFRLSKDKQEFIKHAFLIRDEDLV